MFKSLIEQYKLFVKGATGKDRHQKHQLTQQLIRLQGAYDCLQEDCDTLKRQHDTLQRNLDQLQKKHSQLKGDRNELNALFNYADKENQALDAEIREMRSHFQTREQTLEADNATLQSRVIYLEHKLGLRAYADDPAHSPSSNSPNSDAASDPQQNKQPAGHKQLATGPWPQALATDLNDLTLQAIVDLSNVSLALVGGHETTHREVTEELKKYGLKRCIHIPPHSRESNSRHQIKDKIGNCDLIVTITSYIDHAVSNCVKQLQDTQMLTGEVIRVHCHGKSGVVREVLQYFSG